MFWPGKQESVATHLSADQRLLLAYPVAAFETAAPDGLALGRSYPNPFNSAVATPFQLASAGWVLLEIFNLAKGARGFAPSAVGRTRRSRSPGG